MKNRDMYAYAGEMSQAEAGFGLILDEFKDSFNDLEEFIDGKAESFASYFELLDQDSPIGPAAHGKFVLSVLEKYDVSLELPEDKDRDEFLLSTKLGFIILTADKQRKEYQDAKTEGIFYTGRALRSTK